MGEESRSRKIGRPSTVRMLADRLEQKLPADTYRRSPFGGICGLRPLEITRLAFDRIGDRHDVKFVATEAIRFVCSMPQAGNASVAQAADTKKQALSDFSIMPTGTPVISLGTLSRLKSKGFARRTPSSTAQ